MRGARWLPAALGCALLLGCAVLLAGCGRKGPPSPPGPPSQIIWPRVYPTH